MSDNNNININTPEIGPYTHLQPFRFWCQKVLPLVYDESLSYYELLCKVVDYLNKTMEDVDQMITDMGEFKTADTEFKTEVRDAYIAFSRAVNQAIEDLETFVNNYFNNLDVQQEINNKLDAMAEDGYFNTLFNTLFRTDVISAAQIVTANWIAEHLLQETGYVIDNSLTVANAAADAKVTGDALNGLNERINENTAQLIIEESVNWFVPQESALSSGYIKDGSLVESENYTHTDYIPIRGGEEYVAGLVPVFGNATTPWHNCSNGWTIYDLNKNYVSQGTTAAITVPLNGFYIVFNVAKGAGVTRTIINSRAVLALGDTLPETYSAWSETIYLKDVMATKEELEDLASDFKEKIYYESENRYDSSLQTSETIDPHYYVNGYPYSSTAYDNQYNCTAMFDIEPGTEYTIGLIPAFETATVPWGNATNGIFFYDENETYISGSDQQTFTTPANAKTARFNYWIGGGLSLNVLNASCMLVKGSELPAEYEGYFNYYIKTKIAMLEAEIAQYENPINYVIDSDGNGVCLFSKYDDEHDIVVECRKKGGNDLFDFHKIGLIANTSKKISDNNSNAAYFININTDMHAPFIVKAKTNIDGDDINSGTFTGGNHQYNNTGSGSTPTARTTYLNFSADDYDISTGYGSCKKFEMAWTNLVQGYNTKKVDGSGREILCENHRLIFDGTSFEAFVELIPLEDITMERWYGLQWITTPYPSVRYVGAVNRGLYDASQNGTASGDGDCCHTICFDDSTLNEFRLDIDANYDLGDHQFYSGTEAMFTTTYGKGYCYIIKDTDMDSDDLYGLHGFYTFKKRRLASE